MEERPTRGGPIYWLGRRSRRFWIATVVMVMPIRYVAGFGPACWLHQRKIVGRELVSALYNPLYSAITKLRLEQAARRYAEFGVPDRWFFGWNDGPYWGTGIVGGRPILSKRPAAVTPKR